MWTVVKALKKKHSLFWKHSLALTAKTSTSLYSVLGLQLEVSSSRILKHVSVGGIQPVWHLIPQMSSGDPGYRSQNPKWTLNATKHSACLPPCYWPAMGLYHPPTYYPLPWSSLVFGLSPEIFFCLFFWQKLSNLLTLAFPGGNFSAWIFVLDTNIFVYPANYLYYKP